MISRVPRSREGRQSLLLWDARQVGETVLHSRLPIWVK